MNNLYSIRVSSKSQLDRDLLSHQTFRRISITDRPVLAAMAIAKRSPVVDASSPFPTNIILAFSIFVPVNRSAAITPEEH